MHHNLKPFPYPRSGMLTRRIGNPSRNICPIEDPHLFSNVWRTDSIHERHKNRTTKVSNFIASGGATVSQSERRCKRRVESLKVVDPKDIPPEVKRKAITGCTPSVLQKARESNWQEGSGNISSSLCPDMDDSMDGGFKLNKNDSSDDGPMATSSPRLDSPWSFFNPWLLSYGSATDHASATVTKQKDVDTNSDATFDQTEVNLADLQPSLNPLPSGVKLGNPTIHVTPSSTGGSISFSYPLPEDSVARSNFLKSFTPAPNSDHVEYMALEGTDIPQLEHDKDLARLVTVETDSDISNEYAATHYRLNLASPVDTSYYFRPVEHDDSSSRKKIRLASKPTTLTIGSNVVDISDKQKHVAIKDHIEKIVGVSDGDQCAVYPHRDGKFVSLTAPFAAGKFTRMTNVSPVTKPVPSPPSTVTSESQSSQQSNFPAQLLTSMKRTHGSRQDAKSKVTWGDINSGTVHEIFGSSRRTCR